MPRLRALTAAVTLAAVFLVLTLVRDPQLGQSGSTAPSRNWDVDVELMEATEIAVLADVVLFVTFNGVAARDVGTGAVRWSRPKSFWSFAGSGDASMIVVGDPSGVGFTVLDAATGASRWSNADSTDVLGFSDAILSAGCVRGVRPVACSVVRQDLDGSGRWTTPIPVAGEVGAWPNVLKLGTAAGGPVRRETPPLASLIIDDNERLAIDSRDGSIVGAFPVHGRSTSIVTSDQVVSVETRWQADGCHYSVKSVHPTADRPRWQRDDLDLGTADVDSGCRQEGVPHVDGDTIRARIEDREALISATDGRESWLGTSTLDSVLDVNGRLAVVGLDDHSSLAVVDLATGWLCDLGESDHPMPTVEIGVDRVVIGMSSTVTVFDIDFTVTGDGFCRRRYVGHDVGEPLAIGPSGIVISWDGRVNFLRYG
jgi:hypothetical protein